jgi:dGTPase
MNLEGLAPWACDPRSTRGRRRFEALTDGRNEHQRDRDRIVHSTAFRRLVYKTQVFINHEGDLFRTRLTHSLEVAQLSRSAARALQLNEDLVEAIALAHDLGHTPFGHAGQDALHGCMAPYGGFEHNLQSLRVVDELEVRYPDFDGLNLTMETREGILKHCSRTHARELLATEPDGPAARFISGGQPSLEAQLVNLADELAYTAHDVDDGVRSGLITLEQLLTVPLLAAWHGAVLNDHPQLSGRRLLYEVLRRMLSDQIHVLIKSTAQAIEAARLANPHLDAAAVRAGSALASLSPALAHETRELKRFLFKQLYRHPQVEDITAKAREVVVDLFKHYLDRPSEMSPGYAEGDNRPRAVADYVSGMTDRFALHEHHRLTGRRLLDQVYLDPA